ncbi:hypothetical protein [Brevibacillus laterosporus]|uniref:hypothetical protein n=1 Tax=Brevibacillus laterosporus TaxID=1465 RepID=UPI002653FB7B|nr:hypothetical protein [Brevibacillus laterosporus]MDN9011221.1 hypothetical protein [Brevibacillus laterosporus]MDO0942244.1 hypothetical protein [Brevibacillus laterosporus]
MKINVPTGATGATGATGPTEPTGLGEFDLVFTVQDLYKNGTFDPDFAFSQEVYNYAPAPMVAEGGRIAYWTMPPSSNESDVINLEFQIPGSYVTGTPITVDAHLLIQRNQEAPVSGNVRIRLRADFRSNGDQWGQGTGNVLYKANDILSEVVVTEPTGFTNGLSLRHHLITFPINTAPGVINPGDWAFFTFNRINNLDVTGGYPFFVCFTSVTVRYTL